jgi:hypothetical protein
MKDYLNGKTVALVGPAESIKGSKNGELIDSHDVVVRLNYAKISDPVDCGTRTDVIYYDGTHRHDLPDSEYLVCSYPKSEWFFETRSSRVAEYYSHQYGDNHRIVDDELYNSLKSGVERYNAKAGWFFSRPNTGLIAIADLLDHNIKKLFITGIDFYRTSYIKNHPDYGETSLEDLKKVFEKGDGMDYHDIEGQFEYFKGEVIKDSRLKVDTFLSQYI